MYCKNSDGIVEFVPRSRVQSHLFMEEGEMICEFAGECKLSGCFIRVTSFLTLTFSYVFQMFSNLIILSATCGRRKCVTSSLFKCQPRKFILKFNFIFVFLFSGSSFLAVDRS